MKIARAIVLICISLSIAGCLSMNYYDGPKQSDADVAEVYLGGAGAWKLMMYKIDGEAHQFGFMRQLAYMTPGQHAFRYHTYDSICGETGFVTFNVDLKPGYSYIVTANFSKSDPDVDTACIYEELRNDPAAIKGRLSPREPQDKTKPLQCGSLEWKVWK